MDAPSAYSISDAARRMLVDPAPVVLLDTSALLDVLRTPLRNKTDRLIRSATTLIQHAVATPPRIWLVVTKGVVTEWQENYPGVCGEVDEKIRSVDNLCTPINQALQHLIPGHGLAPTYESYHVSSLLYHLMEQLMRYTVVLAADAVLDARGLERHRANKPPSERGRKEVDDCIITEHYLALSQEFQVGAYTHERLFISSNTKDYCGGGKQLHPSLKVEFDAVGLEFGRDLGWAERYLQRT